MEILKRSYCDDLEWGEEDVRLERAEAVQLFEQAIVGIEQFQKITNFATHVFAILRKRMGWWYRLKFWYRWPKTPDHTKTVSGFRDCLKQISSSKSTVPGIIIPADVYWCAKGWVDSYNKEQSFQASPYR